MSEIKWIKISTNIFNDEKISIIEELPEADTIIVIWFKLLVLAGKRNDGGLVYITRDIPYDPEKLARVMRRPINTVRLALQTFEQFGMITLEDDFIYIENWERHQNVQGMEKIKEQNRIRQQKHRQKQQQIEDNNVMSRDNNVTSRNGDNVKSRDSNAPDKTRQDKNINIGENEQKYPEPTDKKTEQAKELMYEWYNTYNRTLARQVAPGNKDQKNAYDLLERVDLETARKAVDTYFNVAEWPQYDSKKKKYNYNFASFCANIETILSQEPEGSGENEHVFTDDDLMDIGDY